VRGGEVEENDRNNEDDEIEENTGMNAAFLISQVRLTQGGVATSKEKHRNGSAQGRKNLDG
jgi:hypothetical protein